MLDFWHKILNFDTKCMHACMSTELKFENNTVVVIVINNASNTIFVEPTQRMLYKLS